MTESVPRRMWWVVEPIHGVVRAAIARTAAFSSLELASEEMAYFAGRAAPFGAAPAELVASSFYVFAPDHVRRSLPQAWDLAPPQSVLNARLHAVDELFWAVFEDELRSERIDRSAELINDAISMEEPLGRPVFAAHMALDWPTVPHLALWHGATLLREHRGDGHVAALLNEGLDGCSAVVLAVAAGATTAELARTERGWSEPEWAHAVADLVERGLLDEREDLTGAGRELRRRVEHKTDELARGPYERLGVESVDELRVLLTDLARRIVKAGLIAFPNAIGMPDMVSRPTVIDIGGILGAEPVESVKGTDQAEEVQARLDEPSPVREHEPVGDEQARMR